MQVASLMVAMREAGEEQNSTKAELMTGVVVGVLVKDKVSQGKVRPENLTNALTMTMLDPSIETSSRVDKTLLAI